GMLVPVNGTDVSRRGAEFALTLAQAANVPVTALYVANAAEAVRRQRIGSLRQSRDAVLEQVREIAKRHGVELRTASR
ncbi:universal stress protein, partial [[Ruminococcus] torques]|uniref:universal stress protein n=1 Tax=[Ruminococcus] torques TaxID=33039 RepID=UPI001EDE3E74